MRQNILNKETKKMKVVLAYSGGLDTSVILHWLKKEYRCEVIAYCADIGQYEDISELKEKAIKTGASECVILDLKEEFVREYVFPMLRSSSLYEMRYLMGTAIARPLIAKKQVELAREKGAGVVSHGCTGKGNDQVRFELTFMALAPELKIISPWRSWNLQGRSDLIKYAQTENIPIAITPEKPYSIDSNIFHTSYEGGILEDPFHEPNKEMFLNTNDPIDAPDKPEYIQLEFEAGDPKAVDGKELSPTALLGSLNRIAGMHGIGRIDIVENRLVGIKSRGVYETPGGTLIYLAHRDLESIILERDLQHLKDELSVRYADLIYFGKWFTKEREALQALIDKTQEKVSGAIRLKLYKGNASVVGRKSENSIYSSKLASFERNDLYDQAHAEGFIKLYGLSNSSTYLR